jgi:hypothetical protein
VGLNEYIICPEPSASLEEDQEGQKALRNALSEGLRYLCAMLGDKNLRASVALHGKDSGIKGYAYLKDEFLQGQPEQAAYLQILQGLRLKRDESVVLFRNQWDKIAMQLDPMPEASILCQYFATSISALTNGFYEDCLNNNIAQTDYMEYTRVITRLCQNKKTRHDSLNKEDGAPHDTANALSSMTASAFQAAVDTAVSRALKGRDPKSDGRKKKGHEPPGAGKPPPKKEPCIRCGKTHAGGRKACKLPPAKCPFKYPDGTICGGDHKLEFCYGKHPEKCPNKKIREAILRKLNKSTVSSHVAEVDSGDSDEDCFMAFTRPPKDATEGLLDLSVVMAGITADKGTKGDNYLFVDSGASALILVDPRMAIQPERHQATNVRIYTGTGVTPAATKGPAVIITKNDLGQNEILIREALFVSSENFSVNLFSVAHDYETHGTTANFGPKNELVLKSGTKIPIINKNRRYLIPYKPPTSEEAFTTSMGVTDPAKTNEATSAKQCTITSLGEEINLWHRRLGHCSAAVLKHIHEFANGPKLVISPKVALESRLCNVCPAARLKAAPCKQNRKKYNKPIASQFGDCIYMDLAGPLPPSLGHGYRYLSLFIDEYSRYIVVYFLHHKSDQRQAHQRFRADTKHFGTVKKYHSDNGGEYTDKNYLDDIVLEEAERSFTVPRTPAMNALAENAMWRIFSRVRAFLHDSGHSNVHWPLAALHAARIINIEPRRSPTGEMLPSPYNLVKHRKPNLIKLHLWGCQVSVDTLPNKREHPKLGARAEIGYYMGAARLRRGDIVFLPKPGDKTLSRGGYRVSRTLVFRENITPRSITEASVTPTDDKLPALTPSEPVQHIPYGATPDDADEEEVTPVTPAIQQAPASAGQQGSCGTPGCILSRNHSGPHSNEQRGNTGRPSSSLRPRINGRAIYATATAGVHGDWENGYEPYSTKKSNVSVKEFRLPSGALLIHANKASHFDLSSALYATNVLDGEDLVESLHDEDDEAISAFATRQKTFRGEGQDSFQTQEIPRTLKDVLKSPAKDKWVEAMIEELSSHMSAGTWVLIPAKSVPMKRRHVGSTWVFDIKRAADGSIERYKARLCAQGFSQEEGMDYHSTFSNTVRFETLRVIIALAAIHNLHLSAADIKTAYLNGLIEKDLHIFMNPPRGFFYETPTANATFSNNFRYDEKWACLLKRSIYGLKQSGRCWETRLWNELKEIGFTQCTIDPCLWKINRGDEFLLLVIYVDDLVFATNSPDYRAEIVARISAAFKLKDAGQLTWMFGMGIKQDLHAGTVTLSQKFYIEDLVRQFDPPASKGRSIPCTHEILELQKGTDDEMVHPQYRTLIGKLMWIAIISRPDIAFAVTFLARFNSHGTEKHFKTALRIVSYLAVTSEKCICYRREPLGNLTDFIISHSEIGSNIFSKDSMFGFSDASHGGERPMAGHVIYFADAPLSWQGYRLSCTPLSSCQGEYMAATKCAISLVALSGTVKFTGLKVSSPCPILCDNKSAVMLSDSDTSSKRLRHIASRIAFLRELREAEEINLFHVYTNGQVADIFTKPLDANVFHTLRAHLL